MIFGQFDELNCLFTRNRRKAFKKIVQCRIPFNVVDERLYRYAGSLEARRSAETSRVNPDNFVENGLLLGCHPSKHTIAANSRSAVVDRIGCGEAASSCRKVQLTIRAAPQEFIGPASQVFARQHGRRKGGSHPSRAASARLPNALPDRLPIQFATFALPSQCCDKFHRTK